MSKYLTRKEVEDLSFFNGEALSGEQADRFCETLLAYMDIAKAAKEHIKTLHDTEQILNAEELAIEAALEKVGK